MKRQPYCARGVRQGAARARIFAALERGFFSSVERAHPEIEYVIADGLSPGARTGPPGMAEGWREFAGAWEEYRIEAD